jgi:TRAP-type C4-dicarboxylate transport system substrate-binding protein
LYATIELVLSRNISQDKYAKREDRMERKTRVAVVVLFVVLSIVSLMPAQGFAQQKVYELRYANMFPAPHKNSLMCEAWCREVEKRTNGRVKISYFPGGTLTPPAQTYDSITTGITDIGMSVFNYTRGKFPVMDAINQPMGYKSAYLVTKLANEFYKKFKPKELDEVKVMYLHGHGPGIMHTKSR